MPTPYNNSTSSAKSNGNDANFVRPQVVNNGIKLVGEVLLPGALPNIVTGIRTGLGFAWRGLIAAEMIATNVGLGYMLFVARDFYKTEVIVLGMIVIGVLWLLLDRLLLAPIERATSERWGMVQRA